MAETNTEPDALELESQLEAQLQAGVEAPVEPVVETPVAQIEPAPETPVVETPTAEVTTEEPVVTEPETPVVTDPDEAAGRYRLKGKLAAVAQLVKEGTMTEEEAIGRIFGTAKAEPAAPASEPEAQPDPLDDLKSELETVQKTLDEFANEEKLYTADVRKAQKREAELLSEIKAEEVRRTLNDARQREIEEAEMAQEQQTEWNKGTQRVLDIYGDTAKDDGPLGKAIGEQIEIIAADPNHPHHAFFHAGKLTPLHIASYVAAELGIAPKAAQVSQQVQTAPKPKTSTAAQVPTVPLATGAARTTPSVAPNPAQQQAELKARLEQSSGDPDAMAALIDGGPPTTGRSASFRLA